MDYLLERKYRFGGSRRRGVSKVFQQEKTDFTRRKGNIVVFACSTQNISIDPVHPKALTAKQFDKTLY